MVHRLGHVQGLGILPSRLLVRAELRGADDVIVDSDDIACGTMGCGGL